MPGFMRGFDLPVVVIGLSGVSEIPLTIEDGLPFKGRVPQALLGRKGT
jgi:hypothetical protein